jgi:hypothetical protein
LDEVSSSKDDCKSLYFKREDRLIFNFHTKSSVPGMHIGLHNFELHQVRPITVGGHRLMGYLMRILVDWS